MALYRKRPVVIEVWQFDGSWESAKPIVALSDTLSWDGELLIQTLEGVLHGSPGDWIIKGVAGEFYPCKPDIFSATYEPADKNTSEQER